MHKYLAYARLGIAATRAEPAELYGRVAFAALILGVFSALWSAVSESGMPIGDSPRTLLWYLVVTEWVMLSVPSIQFQIEEDVRRGDIAYQITRPVSYLAAQFAQGLGALAVRAPVILVAVCGFGWLFAGGPPEHPGRLVPAFGFAAVALVLMTAFNILLGLLAFWLGDVAPVVWVWHKLIFVLGGLMLPLQVYPAVVRDAARLTPFPALLNGPASFVLGTPLMSAGWLMFTLAFWLTVAGVVAHLTFERATRALQINGG